MNKKNIKKEKNCEWWKVLIVLTFIISLVILCLNVFEIKEEKLIRNGEYKVGNFMNEIYNVFGYCDEVKIITSHCENAYIDYACSYNGEIWINNYMNYEKGSCHIIYEKKVNRLRFRNSEVSEQ
jgi:hypothetical protein